MPLVDIEVIEGVLDSGQKARMIQKVTDAMVEVEGEAMRGVTWVRSKEVRSGRWPKAERGGGAGPVADPAPLPSSPLAFESEPAVACT